MKVYITEIEVLLNNRYPDAHWGTLDWLGKYSRVAKEVSERVQGNKAEEAKVQKLWKEWMDKGPPKDVRRRYLLHLANLCMVW
jgi:hypothetical protein